MGCRRYASTMTRSNASKSDSLAEQMHPANGSVLDGIDKARRCYPRSRYDQPAARRPRNDARADYDFCLARPGTVGEEDEFASPVTLQRVCLLRRALRSP
jgi:hypothetical protein